MAEQDVGELAEHRRVRPVEVPLVVVERGPDPAVELVVPREAARREVGEHLRQRQLVLVGDVPVGEDQVVVALLGVAGPRGRRPGVLAGGVVEHQVDADADAAPAQGGREVAEVVDVAEVGPHRAVVGHRVAAVVGCRPRGQQRHQVEVRHPELHQVVGVVGHLVEGAGEPVGVRRVAQRVRPLEPVRLGQPLVVEVVQLVGPRVVRRPGDRQQPVRDRFGVGVQAPQRGHQVRSPALDAGLEDLSAGQGGAAHGRQYVARSAAGQATGQQTSDSSVHQPRSRHSARCGRSAPRVESLPWPG